MHRHIYRRKIIYTLLIIVFCLGFPALTTLFLNKENSGQSIHTPAASGKYVTITDGTTTESLDVEEFIPCAMMSQISIHDNEEFLKAFSIVLRTLIYEKLSDQTTIDASALKLPYLTYDEMKNTWKEDFAANLNKLNKITQETALLVITSSNALIHPYYHTLSSGITRQGSECYIQPADCPLDLENPDYLQTSVYSIEAFLSSLKEINPEIQLSSTAPLENFQIVSRDNAGYVTELQIGGTAVDVSAFSDKFALASQCFEVDEYNGGIRILTKGVGHGYGMSLYTASQMAKDGKSCTDILNYFYASTAISK